MSEPELDQLVATLRQRANDGTLTATEEANAIAAYRHDPVATARIAKAVFPEGLELQPGFVTEVTELDPSL